MSAQQEPTPGLRELQTLIDNLLARAHDLARALSYDPDLDLERAYDLAHGLDLDLERALARGGRGLGLGGARDHTHSLVLGFALDLARDCDLVQARADAHAQARFVVQQLKWAQKRVSELVAESQGTAVTADSPGTVSQTVARPARTAVWVSRWAARLLPPPARARYADELLDELYVLAEDGAGRGRQIACALRQVLPGAWQLRTALRAERVSGEGP